MKLEFAGFEVSFFDFLNIYLPPWVIFICGLLIIILMLFFYFKKGRYRSSAIKYSDLKIVKRAVRSNRQKYRVILLVLRILAVAFFIVSFARPRSGTEYKEVTSEGIDIILTLDVSSSMQAEDFKPNNRLFVAKEEIKKFIGHRINDRIGLVVFAKYSYTQCPLTTDYDVLMNFIDLVDFGIIEDGTAIGMAIANAVNRLRESESKSKIIVLLTDGDNNAGEIDPITAANLAKAMDIKIYTIGAGKSGNTMYPYQDPLFGKRYVYQPTKIDEKTLKTIAENTGGKYFRARSGKELEEIYNLIDNLEKTEIKIASHVQYKELFSYFTYSGLIIFILELLLAHTVFKKLP